ncbi:NADH-quinone oxidoreductase subunit N [Hoyosella subflava DQS3-9A1]|uniref:NADH-quinone oxidoreductase subunit N n=2 Tax=Hoyosella TaxID=697025 RepID=F6EMY0_HOYSD|nr:NADH-quinone oxidoreductase subunit N [Hoyosella subflava DQS3-9A1]
MTPDIAYSQLTPMLVVFGVAIVSVLVEAFLPARHRYMTQMVLSLTGLVVAFVALLMLAGTSSVTAVGSVAVDGPTLFLQGTIVLVAVVSLLMVGERTRESAALMDAFAPQTSSVPGSVAEREATKAGVMQTEVFPLALFAVGGLMLFPASNDLLTMFIALEVLSLPLYVLCGMARRRRLLSQEAALKYFLLGAFSSAFFLYGVALLYGFAGTLEFAGIAEAVSEQGSSPLALIGVGMLSVGLLFKVGAVPFHTWTPDVYQGAPTSITGFMAAATKIAAFGAMLRVFYVAVPELQVDWRPMLWAIAAITMLVGTIIAVTQTDVKRMLAYSSVAHAGFLLTGIVAANDAGVSATLFYLVAYGFSTLGAFAVVSLVRDRGGIETADMNAWAGLGRQSPLIAGAFALFLLALAGVPLTSGFISKFVIFSAAVEGGAAVLVIIGVLSSAIAAYFYIRVIVLMFFSEPVEEGAIVAPKTMTSAVVAIGVVVTVVLGVMPQSVLDLAERASSFVS